MNHISPFDAATHKAVDVSLCDIWENTPRPTNPIFETLKGNTWGYQTPNARSKRRLDKFLYTGTADIVSLAEVRDFAGKVGRLGIGLKTKVKTWEYHNKDLDIVRSGLVVRPGKSYSDICSEGGVRRELSVWVSDHFAVAIGIRVRQESTLRSN